MYVSRKLLKHERNFATIEKEGPAIRWALGKLQYYLLGREFMLVTDHAPLKWMATHKSNNARITRWFLELQNFRFHVEHRPGTQNANADALSRRHEVMWTIAPTHGSELRRRVCDASQGVLRQSPTRGRQVRTSSPTTPCAPLGRVHKNRYITHYRDTISEPWTAYTRETHLTNPAPRTATHKSLIQSTHHTRYTSAIREAAT